jgi:hypothetical protein
MMFEGKQWLVYWDSNGFESIIDVGTQLEKEAFDLLVHDKRMSQGISSIYNTMTMRARFNPQRSPEIWTFTSTEDITEESLREVADNDPQWLVDWVRKNGHKMYGSASQTARIR